MTPFRASARPSVPLVFGATSMCPVCSLRFAPRAACPACGGPTTPARRRPVEPGLLARLVRFLLALFGAKQLPPPRLRVHAPALADEDVIDGIARRSTITLPSPVGKVECLVFGLHGSTETADIADAEGGDFDVVLADGERVMVSLEHAVLLAGPEEPRAAHAAGDLADLLDLRGIVAHGALTLAETVICDGDRVSITGKRVGASVSLRGARARVLAGDEARPLVVRLL